MKYSALLAAIALVGVAPLFGQTSSTSSTGIPPGWVDGSKTPNLVPDRAAYRLVFINLVLPASPDQNAITRQENHVKRIGLSSADETVLKQALATFNTNYSNWKQTASATSDQAWAIVQTTRDALTSQLSGDGNSKFSAYVALEKIHMIVNPSN